MKILKYLGLAILALFLALGLLIVYATLTYYDPPKELVISQSSTPDTIKCNQEFDLLSWNIGYAGLGDNMDFFYDEGEKVRDTYERTIFNLESITKYLKQKSTYPFILLQEVDIRSKRSYRINEMESFKAIGEYHTALAPNYVVKFVPIPPSSPLGKVNSGIMSMSKYQPTSSTRFAYPGQFGWPTRLFNLRRCMLVNRYPTDNGREFILINTHNSAFDDGSLKKQEMEFLKEFVLNEYSKGNYVVVGGDWNQAPPTFLLNSFGDNYKVEFFKLTNIAANFMPNDWKWVYDPLHPTNRYLNEKYTFGKTFSSIIDIFLVSPNVEIVDNLTFNLNFVNSDHNPISLTFKLKL